jgi:hypothetical protein
MYINIETLIGHFYYLNFSVSNEKVEITLNPGPFHSLIHVFKKQEHYVCSNGLEKKVNTKSSLSKQRKLKSFSFFFRSFADFKSKLKVGGENSNSN